MANSCTGDCMKCSFQQQIYCASQRCYAMLENQRAIVERLDRLEASVESFTGREIIPIEEKKAQKSAGADNRADQPV